MLNFGDKQTTLDLNGPVLSIVQQPQSANLYVNKPYAGTTTPLIQTTYGGYPVRGYLYYPTSANVGSSLDVVVLYHGTITSDGVSPADAASTFMSIALNKVDINDKLVFSVAYPQDAIPLWEANPTLPATQFPGLDYPTLYLGDNIVYAEAALLWVKNNLDSYLSSNNIPKTVNKIYTFGHSQGAYLVHRLNTLHSVDGVISNAPGPIDLLNRCSGDQNTINITCNKIRVGLGTTGANPDAYNSRSLKSFVTGTLSPTLFTQALDDDAYQVNLMQNTFEVGIGTCTNCASINFNYYENGGHDAFVYNPILQNDIRNFVGSESGTTVSFTGLATATFPTQTPSNSATNTGILTQRWYVDGYGPLTDGTNVELGITVVGSATTTLLITGASSPRSNGLGFFMRSDYIPSAYSRPLGSAVIAGTARSTGNGNNEPYDSSVATLTVYPTLSVTSNPSSQEVAEGEFATFTASGSSSDGTAVSIRWLLNGSYLSDNGSTIFGSNTNTLRISLPNASTNLVSAEITHPTASNSPLFTNSALFTVVLARAVINYESFEDAGSSLKDKGSIDLKQQPGNYFEFGSSSYSSTSLYAPERDINVRITLVGAAGGSNGTYRGGCGGATVLDIVLRQNREYILKIGSAYGLNNYPAGGWSNGGGMSIFYKQSQVIAVSGGGGGAGANGRGGDGGAAGQAGESGQGRNSGQGGISVRTGSLGIDGYWQGQLSLPNSSSSGGKLSSCTIGRYWRDQGYSPCENMGNVQLYNVYGDIFRGSATIQRGFKPGLGYRNNGGVAPSTLNGAGGGGAYGGSASTGQSSGYRSGGGGGSGYWNGEGTLRLAVRGGNCSTRGYVRIELLTENTGIPSINPPPPDPPPPACEETYYIYRYGGGGGVASCPVGTIRRGRWYRARSNGTITNLYYPVVSSTEGTVRTVQDIHVSQTGVPADLSSIETYIRYYNAFGEAELRRFIGGSGSTTTVLTTLCGKSFTDLGNIPDPSVNCEPGDGNDPSELYLVKGPFTTT